MLCCTSQFCHAGILANDFFVIIILNPSQETHFCKAMFSIDMTRSANLVALRWTSSHRKEKIQIKFDKSGNNIGLH